MDKSIGITVGQRIGTLIDLGPMDTLQKRLKYARKLRKLSQGKVAELAGISQPTYSDLESGESQSSTRLADIARALGVSLLWLSTGEGTIDGADTVKPNGQDSPQPRNELTEEEALLLKRFRAVDATRQDLVLATLITGNTPSKNTSKDDIAKVFEDLAFDLHAYAEERDPKRKADLLDNILNFVDRRKRDRGPPPGKADQRGSASK